MNTLNTIILAIFASGGFWTFLQAMISGHRKKKTPTENMVLALGRDKLLSLNKKYKKLGYIPEDDYETYIALGNAYIAMGGNTLVRKGFEDGRKLPIREEEKDEYNN